MPSSPTPPPPPPAPSRRINAGTMLPPDLELRRAWRERVRRAAPSPAEAYAIALAADRDREPAAPGYRLYWMTSGLLASRDVGAGPDQYVVVGRHDKCDVVLDEERAVSLRHVLVRSTLLDDGGPTLRVLDLRTGEGFELSDGTKQHGIVATGPIVFRIGAHTLVALPSAGRIPDALPSPLVERFARNAEQKVHAAKIEHPSVPPSSERGPISRITLMGAGVSLSERPSYVPGVPRSGAEWTASPDAGHAFEVVLTMRGLRAAVRFTIDDLEQGVLIGRDEKCLDAGLRPILAESISRVHALIVRERGEQHLYDTGSTNGTFVGRTAVRCVRLLDEGTSVELAGSIGLTLRWRALRPALQ